MAKVSKFGIASLLFGLVLLYLDQGSDIWVGVNFYNACHYRWALTSFLLTSLPTIVMIFYYVFYAINNPKKIALSAILYFIFQPLLALFILLIVVRKREDKDGSVGVLKHFKVAEVVFEAVCQLIFNIYVRSYLAPSDSINGYVQLASIIISCIAIIHGLGDKYACYHRDELMPSIQHVCFSMCIIFFDISLKLSIYILSLLINGISATISWIAAFVMSLAILHLFLTFKHPESIEDQESSSRSNFFEMLFLALINLPNDSDLRIKNISVRDRINKIVTYGIFFIGLSIMTGMLFVHQSNPTAYYWLNHIDNEDIVSSTLNCENLCDVEKAFNNMQGALKNDTSPWANLINPIYDYHSIIKDMKCSKMLLTSSHLLIWIWITWFLLAICIVQVICDYKNCGIFFKLVHNMITIKENDNQENQEQFHLEDLENNLPDNSNELHNMITIKENDNKKKEENQEQLHLENNLPENSNE